MLICVSILIHSYRNIDISPHWLTSRFQKQARITSWLLISFNSKLESKEWCFFMDKWPFYTFLPKSTSAKIIKSASNAKMYNNYLLNALWNVKLTVNWQFPSFSHQWNGVDAVICIKCNNMEQSSCQIHDVSRFG